MLIVTAHDKNFQECAKITLPNKEEYATRHKYSLICQDLKNANDFELLEKPNYRDYVNQHKMCLMRQLCKDNYNKWIVWIDADAIIMNMTIPLENFIDNNYDFIIGEDWNGINAGVYFIKGGKNSTSFIEKCISYIPTEYDRKQTPKWWWISEQCAYTRCLSHIKTKLVHHSLFNGYFVKPIPSNIWFPEKLKTFQLRPFRLGDFILHAVSGPLINRINTLRKCNLCVIK